MSSFTGMGVTDSRPILLDLFCCAGGAARGYDTAGFQVVGVDIDPQPHYPYPMLQWNALEVLDMLLAGETLPFGSDMWNLKRIRLSDIAAIHASPPCQGYSVTKSVNKQAGKYPLLIPDVRTRLVVSGKPYVIENVEGAKSEMRDYVTLCGSQFGMRGVRNGRPTYLQRHRLFESNFRIPDPGPHDHSGYAFTIAGHGAVSKKAQEMFGGSGFTDFARELMGMDWTTRHELAESIPPAYTQYVGAHMMDAIKATGIGEAA